MGKSRFKLPQIMPVLFSFSSSKEASIIQQRHERNHNKATGRMIFGCQAFDSMSKNVRTPCKAQKSRVRPEDRMCSPPTNCKKIHAYRSLSTSSMSKLQSHSSSLSVLEDTPELVSEDEALLLTSENNGNSGTPIEHLLHDRRDSRRSKKGVDFKARRRLSFGCDTHIKPQMGDSSEDKRGFEEMSAAMQNLDIGMDTFEKVDAWNVLGNVKSKIVRKRDMLRKRRGYKRIQSPSLFLHDSANYTSKAKQLKLELGCFRRVDDARFERRAGSSVCSYTLSTSSMDASLDGEHCDSDMDGEHCASDRDQASSFASEHSFVQRSCQEEATVPTLGNSPAVVELGAFYEKDSSIYRASETHQLQETPAGENASFSFKLAFRTASKLASESQRKGIACSQRIVRKRKRFVSESIKMLDKSHDPALLKKGYSRHSNDLESSSKRWIKPPPSNIILQRTQCNIDVSETHGSSVAAKSSRALNTATDSESSTVFNSGYKEIHDPVLSVQATVSPSPMKNNAARGAAALQHQCWSKTCNSKAPLQIVPMKKKKVRDGIAVVKSSYNPYQDFQTSMVEMILSKRIREPAELNELLECYIALNSSSYRELIITAFEDAWQHIFSIKASSSAQSMITPPLHFFQELLRDPEQ